MAIKFLEDKKRYRVGYSERHPETKRPISKCRICYLDKNGKRQPITTEYQANKMYKHLVILVKDIIKHSKVPTWGKVLEEFESYYLETGVTQKTVETYSLCLNKHTKNWNHLCCDEINDSLIRSLISSSSKSESHKKNLLKFIRKVLDYAHEKGYINRNPTPKIKFKIGKTNIKVLKENEVSILLSTAKIQDCEWYYHWAVALHTGMRNGELYALRWDHIDLESNKINVKLNWNNKDGFKCTKSGNERLIEIAPNLKKILSELKLTQHHPEFVLPRNSRWDKGEQARCLRMFLMGLGLPVINFHDLRATWTTLLLSKGVPPVKVMAMGGWADLKTMMRYIRRAGIDLSGATNCLNFHDPSEPIGKILNFEAM